VARLIDADRLMQDIAVTVVFSTRPDRPSAELRGARTVVDRIEAAPTVDAVEVVRCRDCKYWVTDVSGCTEFVRRCELASYMIGAAGFCLYGERRENEQTGRDARDAAARAYIP
jgi:hypothetical protein